MFDAEFNAGTKALSNTGIKRMNALAEWAMQRPEDTVVCVGHSLYFRSFFRVRRGEETGGRGEIEREEKRGVRVCVLCLCLCFSVVLSHMTTYMCLCVRVFTVSVAICVWTHLVGRWPRLQMLLHCSVPLLFVGSDYSARNGFCQRETTIASRPLSVNHRGRPLPPPPNSALPRTPGEIPER